ncbi:hypothetical protein F0Z19_3840 [Vibrio cyclitrophicus]|nr:hypothetical protein F0Z19_3840 [Vibrio cyclitrophicus]
MNRAVSFYSYSYPLEVMLEGDLKRVLDALNRIKYGYIS